MTGKATGGLVKNLASGSWMRTVSYFDPKFRLVQSIADNIKGGTDRTTVVLDFTGKPLRQKTTHTAPSLSTQIILRRFTYDGGQRLVHSYHKLNSGTEVLLFENQYNELGQLVAKRLHASGSGSTFRQTVDYRYNIRGVADLDQ